MKRLFLVLCLLIVLGVGNGVQASYSSIKNLTFATGISDDGRTYTLDVAGPYTRSFTSWRDIFRRDTYSRYLMEEMSRFATHVYSDTLGYLDEVAGEARKKDPLSLASGRYDMKIVESGFLEGENLKGVLPNYTTEHGYMYFEVVFDIYEYPPEYREEILKKIEEDTEKFNDITLQTRRKRKFETMYSSFDVIRNPRTNEIEYVVLVAFYAIPLKDLEAEFNELKTEHSSSSRFSDQQRGRTPSSRLPDSTPSLGVRGVVYACDRFGSKEQWQRYIENLDAQGITLSDEEWRMLDNCDWPKQEMPESQLDDLECKGIFGCLRWPWSDRTQPTPEPPEQPKQPTEPERNVTSEPIVPPNYVRSDQICTMYQEMCGLPSLQEEPPNSETPVEVSPAELLKRYYTHLIK